MLTSGVRAGCVPGAWLFVSLVVLAAWQSSSNATEPFGYRDKGRYWLFNPTPENLMREMTTDRPDMTESPFTVDAGHVQLETHVFNYSRSRPDVDGVVANSYEYGEINIRIGLTDRVEFNVVAVPCGLTRMRPADPAFAARNSGPGGIDLRMKVNLWGNDTFETSRATALSLLSFVTLPTDRDNGIGPSGVEGGFILPFVLRLSERWVLGLNGGFHIVRNEDISGTRTEWLSSASFCYEWSDALNTYYEVAGRFGKRDPRGDIGMLGTGFTYKLGKNLQLDGGVNFGVTKAADRINPFVGISARF